MYIHKSADRFYRSSLNVDVAEQHISIRIEESDLYITLTSDIKKDEILPFIQNELYSLRSIIKAYCIANPFFQSSLIPLAQDNNAPTLIQKMLHAGICAQIGPFSAVAGCLAEALAHKIHIYLKEKSLPSDVLLENGGDIYIISQKERKVAILDKPKQNGFGINLGVSLMPTYNDVNHVKGISLCSSSSTIGHSISFGSADLVLIIAKEGNIADSFATATCNMLKSKEDFPKIIEYFKKNKDLGLVGIFASCQNEIMAFGEIELCEIEID